MIRSIAVSLVITGLLVACGDDRPTESSSDWTTWEQAIGGPGDEWAQGVAVAEDGSIVVVGARGPVGNTDALIIMTDSNGQLLWELVQERAHSAILYDVTLTADSQIIAVGREGGIDEDTRMLVVKCDWSGRSVWVRAYPSIGYDEARAVISLDDRSCIIGGTKTGYGQTGRDLFVMRIDPNGEYIWRQSLVTSLDQDGFDLAEMSDGSVVLTGITQLPDNTYQPMLLHTTRAGDALDQWTIARSVSYHPIAAVGLTGNQILLSTWRNRGSDGLRDWESDEQFFVLDASGELIWEYTTPDNDGANYIYDMVSTPAGGVLAVGSTSSRLLHASARDIHIVRIDASGQVDASGTIGYHSFEDGYAVARHPGGGYVIAGATRSIGHGGSDIYLIRTDEDGRAGLPEE
ncbi:MAG: hypothetical protein Kow0074_16240 [Candidatus Zixiibacteriota bacterium]